MSREQEHEIGKKQSCGNDGARGKPGKTNPRFSTLPPAPWKSLRDSHILTAPTTNPIYLLTQTRTAAGLRPWPTELTESSCR